MLEGGSNSYKPYIYIGAVNNDFFDNMPVKLVSGRLPENNTEILLPEHIEYNGGVEFSLGQEITLDVGHRVMQRGDSTQTLWQYNELDAGEELIIDETLTYTVTGFYERPAFEDWPAPGYSALTMSGIPGMYPVNVYFSTYDPYDVYTIADICEAKGVHSTINSTLMRFTGDSREKGLNKVLYGLGSVLMSIIVFASISLIYNAFTISVSERTKRFGLLSSLGATRKQIFGSVIYEALTLCLAAVPLGIASGLAGIGATLYLTQNLFRIGFEELVFMGADDVYFRMEVSWRSVIIPAITGVITVLVSALIPAWKAVQGSAIEAIRQTNEINIGEKDIKTSPLAARIFRFEGMIAARNFRRSRRRYRATIISLFISIVLFISAYSFSTELKGSIDDLVDSTDYDLSYTFYPDDQGPAMGEIYSRLKKLNGIYKSGYNITIMADAGAARWCINPDAANKNMPQDDQTYFQSLIVFVDDENYNRWLEKNGYSPARYMDGVPVAYTTNCMELWDSGGAGAYYVNTLKQNPVTVSLYQYDTKLYIADFCDNVPYGISDMKTQMPLIMPYSMIEKVIPGIEPYMHYTNMVFSAKDPYATETKMYSTLGGGPSAARIQNTYQEYRRSRAIINIVNVFTLGFIVLIGLIAAANVFNTVSTNINLRRREFAVMRSVGMARGGMGRMMMYECMLCGIRAIGLGVPVGLGFSLIIHDIVSSGYSSGYVLPLKGIIIAVTVVMTVVAVTMYYAGRRVSRENTIDALKNENL